MDFKYIILGLVMLQVSSGSIPDVAEFFSEIDNDLSQITWAHAVNSMSLFQEAMSNDLIMMLEADVVKGHLNNETSATKLYPIMAHPPDTTSDLSLQMFIDKVIEANEQDRKLGVKLDFKDLDIVLTSLEILRNKQNMLTFPVWLNADILKGPGGDDITPVNAEIFLSLCKEFFPDATLSIGWTTGYVDGQDLKYTDEMVQEMIDALDNSTVNQPITFPVRAAFVRASSDALMNLQSKNSAYTFTVWTSPSDKVNIKDLADFQHAIGDDSVYFDLPEDQMNELRKYHRRSHVEVDRSSQRKAGGDNSAQTNFNLSSAMFLGFVCLAISVLGAPYFR